MRHVAILYFSGTGNTWAVAQMYAGALTAAGCQVTLRPLELLPSSPDGAPALDGCDLIGVGYPVYAWNAPRLVAHALRRLPRARGRAVFAFVTAGTRIAGALDWVRSLLRRKGYAVVHEAFYYTGAGMTARSLDDGPASREVRRAFAWFETDIQEAVAEILAGRERHIHSSDMHRLALSGIGWGLYRLGCRYLRLLLRADARCDGCGLCQRLCPAHNIEMLQSRPRFGASCSMCLRCYGVCPRQAIWVGPYSRCVPNYLAPGFEQAVAERPLQSRLTDSAVNLKCMGP